MPIATETVWKQFSERLRKFIQKRVAEPGDADDILQEVFLKIHRKIHTLKDAQKIQSWIYQIARNAVIDYYRSRDETPESGPARPMPWPGPAPAENASHEIASCLKPMITRLPPEQREAAHKVEFEGMRQTELAKRLNLSVSGAKSRVQRGRENIKSMLLECCHFEFDRRGKIIDFRPKENGCAGCGDPPPMKK